MVRGLSVLLVVLTSCKVRDVLYCDPEHPCTDPARLYCDFNGEYPESEGVGRTCIADPLVADGGGGTPTDAAPADSGGMAELDGATERRVVQLATGVDHTCAVLNDGGLRCWGAGNALGYPGTQDIGDDEHPYEAGDVPTGGRVKQVAAGRDFTCALYEAGNVRCWGGRNEDGQLGYGHTEPLSGPENTPDRLPDVEVNGDVDQIAAGLFHVCARLTSGDVRCWGSNERYQAATGDTEDIGDDELPGSRSPVQIGAPVVSLSVGAYHSCVVVPGGAVRCWSKLTIGPLGYQGVGTFVGDDETPEQAGDLNIGGAVGQIEAGDDHSCALLDGGRIRCWGRGQKADTNFPGVLGYQEVEDIGDDESPASAGDIDLGGTATALASAGHARCALLDEGSVRCWGRGGSGVLGRGSVADVGDDETPAEVGPVPLGGRVVRLSTGGSGHICALLETGGVRCWGSNTRGELGLATIETIGDDELPVDVPEIRVLE